jgi:hypothetical protein
MRMNDTMTDDTTLIAWLNDLLQLDHDAVAAYGIALKELDSPQLRTELQQHLADHERHIMELERHIETLGGMTVPMPHTSGVFKLAVQGAVAAGGDKAVLLAFKANEMQSRDKYARASEREMPPEIANTVRRAASDERRHYEWAVRSLEALGVSEDDLAVKATKVFAQVHGRTADAIEAVERGGMNVMEKTRRGVKRDPVKTVITAGLVMAGAGIMLAKLVRR